MKYKLMIVVNYEYHSYGISLINEPILYIVN